MHWILQLTATVGCIVGLIIACILSVQSVEYGSFSEPHQILGILAIVILCPQLLFGYFHHQNYKKLGERSLPSHVHIWTGRTVILLGMLDGVL